MAHAERKRFGKRIRSLRLEKTLTQEALAIAAQLHPTYIGGIERGERNVGFDNILKLAKALGQSPSALFVDFTTGRAS